MSAELDDPSAVAFGGPALGRRVNTLPRPALLDHLHAQFPAGLSFAVEGLSHRGRAAHLAEQQDFHLKIAALSLDLQEVADADVACRLHRLLVGFNPAKFAGARRQAARLEKTGRPQPLINANASHWSILIARSEKRRLSGPAENSPSGTIRFTLSSVLWVAQITRSLDSSLLARARPRSLGMTELKSETVVE